MVQHWLAQVLPTGGEEGHARHIDAASGHLSRLGNGGSYRDGGGGRGGMGGDRERDSRSFRLGVGTPKRQYPASKSPTTPGDLIKIVGIVRHNTA